MRVTVLLGAGTSLEIGGVLANTLTLDVIKKEQEIFDKKNKTISKRYFLEEIEKELNKLFYPNKCNFEDIFHTLEMLISYKRGWEKNISSSYKPHLCAFVKPQFNNFFKDDSLLLMAKIDLLTVVANKIYSYDSKFDPMNKHNWFASFWEDTIDKCPLDITTFNYDTCIEKSIPNKYTDGFEDTGHGFYRFNSKNLNSDTHSNLSRLMHLHGCILYGYPQIGNAYIYEDAFDDLYKYNNYEDAKETWFGRSNYTAQSHEDTIISPIITGLRKTDKIAAEPYISYNMFFNKSIYYNNRLLIVGYSFGDLHINNIIERITKLHGDNRKIVIITWFENSANWHPDTQVMDWPDNEMSRFIAKSFKKSVPFSNFSFINPIVSDDKCVYIYLKGFKDAVLNYKDHIITFLTN